jgi:glycosyltransferase involved in cell wall biosynthesis
MCLVSIVVPHRNNCDGLKRLLASIPSGSMFKTIVVDDNSDSFQRARLENLKNEFCFDLVLNNAAGFAGRARNIGLGFVDTEWVIFADSDDFFVEGLENVLASYVPNADLDIVYFNVTSLNEDGEVSYRHLDYSNLVMSFVEGEDSERRIGYLYTPPWGKLIRTKFINSKGIRFDEVPASNDVFFSVVAGHYARNIAVCEKVLYCVTQRAGSITNTVNERNLLSKFNSAIKVNKFLCSVGKRKFRHSIIYFLYRAITINVWLFVKMLWVSVISGNNPLIGIGKILNYRSVVKMRESR